MKAKKRPAVREMERSMAYFGGDISGNELHWKGEDNIIGCEWICFFWVLTHSGRMYISGVWVFPLCSNPSEAKGSTVRGGKTFPLQAVSLLLWEMKHNLLLRWSFSSLDRAASFPRRSTLSSPSCSPWSSFLCSTPSSPTSSWSCSNRLPRRTRSAPSAGSRRCSACPWSPAACRPWSTAWGSCVSIHVFGMELARGV